MASTAYPEVVPVPAPIPLQQPSRFDMLVRQNELSPIVAQQLFQVLNMCEIVLVCDDSGSMAEPIIEDAFKAGAKQSTRWMELKKLASVLIEIITATNPNGLDLYFFHRGIYRNITDSSQLQNLFSPGRLVRPQQFEHFSKFTQIRQIFHLENNYLSLSSLTDKTTKAIALSNKYLSINDQTCISVLRTVRIMMRILLF